MSVCLTMFVKKIFLTVPFLAKYCRSDLTGLSEEHLRDAMPLKEVQEKILEILYNGESIGMARVDGGKAKLLVGHSLEHDLDCLNMSYPDHLIR